MSTLRSRIIGWTLLVVTTLQSSLGWAAPAGPYLDIPSVPFYIGQSVSPNILLTLDDSGSMAWAYVPDDFASSSIIAFKSNLNGMYYNPTQVYTAPLKADGTPYTTSFTAAYYNGFYPAAGSMNLATSYRPFDSLDPDNPGNSGIAQHCAGFEKSGAVCPGVNVGQNTGTRAYYWVYTVNPAGGCRDEIPGVGGGAGWTPPVSCFSFRSITAAEEQNFANWFSFYKSRNLAVVSSAMLAFYNLPSDYRVAWQALNSCTGGSSSFSSACRGWESGRSTVDARLAPFSTAKRNAMWTWLERLPAQNGTPLRQALDRAGQYLTTTGSSGPYADTIGDPTTTYASCRQSYSVMMTDGIWNSAGPGTSVGNEDASGVTLPDGRSYTPQAPYSDGNSASLADIAFKYWKTDLQPGIPNLTRPYLPFASSSTPTAAEYWDPRNDPANWQHMTSFFVGLGLSASLRDPDWMGSTYAGSATAPYSGYYSILRGGMPWPGTWDNSDGNVADMWHGAINSRGAFFSAETPAAMLDAFRQINNRIADGVGASTAVAASSVQVQAESMAFTAQYSTTRWDGTVKGYRVNSDGTVASTPSWSTDTTFDFLGATKWSGNTRVYTSNRGGNLVNLHPNNLAGLHATDKAALDSDAALMGVSTAAILQWVLGDTSNGALRQRDRLLGDILGSQPVFEGGRDYGYVETMWPPLANGNRIDGVTYANYVRDKSPGGTKYRPTVYVGSNDGMLHAFNGDTGARRFSFVPSALLPKLAERASPTYIHQYYVDGPIALHDVYKSSSNQWRTILVASTGGGARGLFALDVTDPDNPSLLWEFFPADNDLGYVYGEPVIARAADGTWVVAFGNGYGSQNNGAYLYVLDAFSGAQLKKLELRDTTAATPTSAQGLSAPALLYLAGRTLGFGYVGDWQGNLWRVDMGAAPSSWTVGFSGKPLFKARGPTGAVQRITAKPRVLSDRVLGRVIVFGTGKLLETTDKADVSTQTLYGIYDWPSGGTTASRADLTQQTITSQTATTRTTSTNALSATAKRGWYLDILSGGSGNGERIVAPVVAIPEISVILATTIKPTGDACDTSMGSAVIAVSPYSGAANNLFDIAGSRSNGVLIAGSMGSPAVIRKGGKLTIMINRARAGIEQLPVTKSWNPRAAWRQLN